jgi:hypothetical protein
MIDLKHHIEGLSWELDKQWHVNHDGCPAGTDTKKRLYVKAVDTYGKWIGYCHHCNDSGVVSSGSIVQDIYSRVDAPLDTVGVPYSAVGPAVARLWDESTEEIPVIPSLWLKKWYLDETDYPKIPVRWRQANESLVFQFGVSIQMRGFNSPLSKYVTHYVGGNKYKHFAAVGNSELVITEDIISAYRAHRDLGVSAIALLGTTVPEALAADIAFAGAAFSTITLWLDADVAGASATGAAYRAIANAAHRAAHVNAIKGHKSPKELTIPALQHIYRGMPK